jgi:hypothetical protein
MNLQKIKGFISQKTSFEMLFEKSIKESISKMIKKEMK